MSAKLSEGKILRAVAGSSAAAASEPPSRASKAIPGKSDNRCLFPSLDWCRALADAIHADSRSAEAGRGWHGTVCVAVRADDTLREPFSVFARIADGRILEIRELEDEDEIDELSPDYEARADCQTWKRFILGEYDPIEALLQRKIIFRGDLKPIAERAQYKQLFWDALASVPPRFHSDDD